MTKKPITQSEREALVKDVRVSIEQMRAMQENLTTILETWDKVIVVLTQRDLPDIKPKYERNQR